MSNRILRPVKFSPESVMVGPIDSGGAKAKDPLSSVDIDGLVQARVKEFEERCQAEREEAYRSGFEAGKASEAKLLSQQLEDVVGSFASMIEDVKAQRDALFKEAEEAVVRLAFTIAQKIIGNELKTNEEVVLKVVRDSLEHLRDKSNLLVKVNPEDLEVVGRHHQDRLTSVEGLKIVGDSSVSRGGCLIETDSGEVDARIERQLEILGESLLS